MILLFGILASCCRSEDTYPGQVREALKKAGENRSELIKVIEHYRKVRADSLKLEATYRLIASMPGHWSSHRITSSPIDQKRAYRYIDSLTRATFFRSGGSSAYKSAALLSNVFDTKDFIVTDEYINFFLRKQSGNTGYSRADASVFKRFLDRSDSIRQILEKYSGKGYAEEKVWDVSEIQAAWLIDHIDNCFWVWRNSTYARNMTYTEFCEILLPYCTRYEVRDIYSSHLRKIFFDLIQSKESSLKDVIDKLNFYIYCLDVFEDEGKKIGELGFFDVLQFYKFDCDRHSEWTVRLLNACGLPAALDFTPGFFNRNKMHYGVSVRDRNGKYNHFTPKWQSLGDSVHSRMFSKVYRRTFESKESPATLRSFGEDIPPIFSEPFIADVTNEYHKVQDIELPFECPETNLKLGYIGIFTPSGWKPIGWGKINHNRRTISFAKVPVNFCYISGYFRNGKLITVGNPFIVSATGSIRPLRPKGRKISVQIIEKCPEKRHFLEMSNCMIGAKIQGANKMDFSDKRDLHTLSEVDVKGFQEKKINVSSNKAFRYARCIAKNGYLLNIATLGFCGRPAVNISFQRNGKDVLTNACIDLLGLAKKAFAGGQHAEFAFDDNPETFVNAIAVNVDFGAPHYIEEISFLQRNSNNGIVVGNHYELMLFDEKWRCVENRQAKSEYLLFKNLPSEGLYWLRNITRGKEEQIFTIKSGRQLFLNDDSTPRVIE